MTSVLQFTEEQRRDLVLFVALGQLLEEVAGLSADDLLTAEELEKYNALVEPLEAAPPEAEAEFIALTRTMFNEVLERTLAEEVAETGAET